MSRLQKKCFIASTGFHLLLALILFVGPAFLSSKSAPDNLPILDFVPVKTVDALVSGGGNPKAQPPPAPEPAPPTPPTPAPAPPPPAEKPDPAPKETVKEVKPPKPEEESFEVSDKPKKPQISTKLITRQPDPQADAKAKADAQAKAEAQQLADARRRAANALGRAAQSIGSEVARGTTIELKGPGGGGLPYANFLQAVKTVYANAWIVPEGVTDEDATTLASVTIARDGRVVSSRIARSSGNSDVDRSVQRTLDRVRYAAPLPDDAKEDERTVEINFNVRAKRALG